MRNPVNRLFVLVLVLLVNASCKKKKEAEAVIDAPTLTQQTTIPSKIDGYVYSVSYFAIANVTLMEGSMFLRAGFYNQSRKLDSAGLDWACDSVGVVALNGQSFDSEQWVGFYAYNPTPTFLPEIQKSRTYSISGAGTFPKMSLFDNNPIPSYDYNQSVPDTIYRLKETTIKLGKFSNADEVFIRLIFTEGSGTNSKKINLSDTEFKISPEDYGYFDTSMVIPEYSAIYITLSKTTYKIIDGKTFQFITEVNYSLKTTLKLN